MNAITKYEGGALALSEAETIKVLKSSLYPGAADESIKMVLGYCKAAGLDPFQKPVHIVPMWDSKAKQMRDVIMPGVNLYRTQAARSGQFAGMSEPEYGPMIEETLGGTKIRYPEWARVTVEKLLDNGAIGKFTAIEYWIENYAVKGGQEKSIAPNAMWAKRPRGQVGKCAQAQALRLAFPEIASAPTADEMEGKAIYDAAENGGVPSQPSIPPALLAEAQAAAGQGVEAYRQFWKATGPENRVILNGKHAELKAAAENVDRKRTIENGEVDAKTGEITDVAPAEDDGPGFGDVIRHPT